MQHTQIIPANALPLVLANSDRATLEKLTEALIEHLDQLDGDCDLEEDDHPGQCSEDEISCGPMQGRSPDWAGPGCPLSDPGGEQDSPSIW